MLNLTYFELQYSCSMSPVWSWSTSICSCSPWPSPGTWGLKRTRALRQVNSVPSSPSPETVSTVSVRRSTWAAETEPGHRDNKR